MTSSCDKMSNLGRNVHFKPFEDEDDLGKKIVLFHSFFEDAIWKTLGPYVSVKKVEKFSLALLPKVSKKGSSPRTPASKRKATPKKSDSAKKSKK